jgi:hypothetical protein
MDPLQSLVKVVEGTEQTKSRTICTLSSNFPLNKVLRLHTVIAGVDQIIVIIED